MINETDVILFPTDTVYGIGVKPNKEALNKLYEIKKRDRNKKIVALVSSKEKAYEILEENILVYNIIDKCFPGELTIISKANVDFLEKLGYSDDIGVRMPSNNIALKIIEDAGGILMTSSANLSGENAAIRFEDVSSQIINNVDIVIKNDNGLSGTSSSIYKIIENEIFEVRKGNFKIDNIEKIKEETFEK